MVQASRRMVWAVCVMAMPVAGCGGGPSQRSDAGPGGDAIQSNDVMQSGDATQSSDAIPDLPVTDGASDDATGLLCFLPTECPAGLTCCIVLEGNSGTVSCQASCVPGSSTWIACATEADCPPTQPVCTPFLTTNLGRTLYVCSQ